MTNGETATGNGAAVTAPSPPPAIEFRDISKAFGEVQANRAVNLDVPKGEIHGIVGENGAGKSTLMSILYGFYEADSGEILVEVVDMPAALRAMIESFVAQCPPEEEFIKRKQKKKFSEEHTFGQQSFHEIRELEKKRH